VVTSVFMLVTTLEWSIHNWQASGFWGRFTFVCYLLLCTASFLGASWAFLRVLKRLRRGFLALHRLSNSRRTKERQGHGLQAGRPFLRWMRSQVARRSALCTVSDGLTALVIAYCAAGAIAYVITVTSYMFNARAATLFLTRLTNPGNGVSPVMALSPVIAAMTLFLALHLKRSGMPKSQRVNSRMRYVEQLLRMTDGQTQHSGRGRNKAAKMASHKHRHLVPPPVSAANIITFVAICLVVRLPRSHEGPWFDHAYMGGSLLVYMLVAQSLARAVWLWRELRGILNTLVHHPLRQAFARLPRGLFTSRISTRAPQIRDLEPLVIRMYPVNETDRHKKPHARPDREPPGGPDTEIRKLLEEAHREAMDGAPPAAVIAAPIARKDVKVDALYLNDLRRHPSYCWWDSTVWRTHLKGFCESTAVKLQPVWRGVSVAKNSAAGEEAVAIVVGLSVREILARLANAALFSTVALFLLLASHTFFPFAPKQTLLGVSWVAVLVGMTAALSIFMRIDRNAAISAITGTTAGELNWDSTLLTRVVVFGILPFASLIAAQFPQFSDLISQLIAPIQHVVP